MQGTISLAGSLKIVNEALCSLDLGFNEIRVLPELSAPTFAENQIPVFTNVVICSSAYFEQDNGAFALARALKANEEPALTSLNLASKFITKYGQVNLA